MVNAVEKYSGRLVTFSPFRLEALWKPLMMLGNPRIDLSSVTSLSAAFPLISTESELPITVEGYHMISGALNAPYYHTTLTPVDGGFVDNSGAY